MTKEEVLEILEDCRMTGMIAGADVQEYIFEFNKRVSEAYSKMDGALLFYAMEMEKQAVKTAWDVAYQAGYCNNDLSQLEIQKALYLMKHFPLSYDSTNTPERELPKGLNIIFDDLDENRWLCSICIGTVTPLCREIGNTKDEAKKYALHKFFISYDKGDFKSVIK